MSANIKPFLSICIPTFNRCIKVRDLVNNLLKYNGTDIEIVVLDNCSPDSTSQLLSRIKDSRLRYEVNENNIGGILNPLKVFTKARGQYSLLCLDKDYLDYQYIPGLIISLKKSEDIVFGYCGLNLIASSPGRTYDKGFSSVMNMSYSSKHPSGYFYKTELLINSTTLREIFASPENFGFYFELINAEMSFKGRSKVINLPLVFTESRNECAKIPSYTYNRTNLYFTPENRQKEYFAYMRSASKLDLPYKEKYEVVKSLFKRGLISSTFLFKSILADSDICSHHGIDTRKLGDLELVKVDLFYSISFILMSMSINRFKRVIICAKVHYQLINERIRK